MEHWKRIMDMSKRNFCRRCGLPEALQDPYRLWDSLPCPPPWNKEIIFTTEWNRRLGLEEGLRIIFRIAKRCNITTPDTHRLPGRVAASMILTSCEVECRSIVVLTCLILLVVGIIIVTYLIYMSERHRKLAVINKKEKQKWSSSKERKMANGDGSQMSFGGQTEVESDICRRELYVTLEGGGGSPPTGENVRFMHHCQLNTYGNLPDTPVAGVSNFHMKKKHQSQSYRSSTESSTVYNFESDSKDNHVDTFEHLYETLSEKNPNKFSIGNNYQSFCESAFSVDPSQSDGIQNGEDKKSSVGHLYETLTMRSGIQGNDSLSSCDKFLDSPLSGNMVRRWEYQATLNRKARIKWTE